MREHDDEGQIVEAIATITTYIIVSKFDDALGVELESVFDGIQPILFREGAAACAAALASAAAAHRGAPPRTRRAHPSWPHVRGAVVPALAPFRGCAD